MELLSKILLLAFAAIYLAACGVKGAPLPPLNPAPLGRGEPTYSEATRSKAKQKNKAVQAEEAEESTNSESSGGTP